MAGNQRNNRGRGACGGGGCGGGNQDVWNEDKKVWTPFGWRSQREVDLKSEQLMEERNAKARKAAENRQGQDWFEMEEQERKKKEKEDEEYAQRQRAERWDWSPEKKK